MGVTYVSQEPKPFNWFLLVFPDDIKTELNDFPSWKVSTNTLYGMLATLLGWHQGLAHSGYHSFCTLPCYEH